MYHSEARGSKVQASAGSCSKSLAPLVLQPAAERRVSQRPIRMSGGWRTHSNTLRTVFKRPVIQSVPLQRASPVSHLLPRASQVRDVTALLSSASHLIPEQPAMVSQQSST
jgi:hypothetical protein